MINCNVAFGISYRALIQPNEERFLSKEFSQCRVETSRLLSVNIKLLSGQKFH